MIVLYFRPEPGQAVGFALVQTPSVVGLTGFGLGNFKPASVYHISIVDGLLSKEKVAKVLPYRLRLLPSQNSDLTDFHVWLWCEYESRTTRKKRADGNARIYRSYAETRNGV